MDLAGLLAGLCRSGPDQLTTVVHGELWENNILLANDLSHVGDGVKVVDWKNAKIATATLDLVRYLPDIFQDFLFLKFDKFKL